MSENKTIVKKVCPCCEKHTVRDEKHKKALLNRLKRIEGQVRGIEAMIENDAYCNDVLIQSAAVNAAMNAFNKELLASHIRGCVARDIREGKDFVWISNNSPTSMTNICIYTSENRDSVMRKNIKGETDDMYMTTNKESVISSIAKTQDRQG